MRLIERGKEVANEWTLPCQRLNELKMNEREQDYYFFLLFIPISSVTVNKDKYPFPYS